MKVVVGASSFANKSNKALDLLLKYNIEVVKNPYGRKMTEIEIIEHLQGADGILAGLEPLNETVFQNSPNLKAIARIGIGMDNVDQEAAKKYGIKVSNTPDAPTNAVAEMTLTALLAIERELITSNSNIHNNKWVKTIGSSLEGLNILIIGFGRIGRKVSEILQYFNANIMVYDKFSPHLSTISLEEGLKTADVISLHASGKGEILTQETFSIMKHDMVILNSARGELINEEALYNALNDGTVKNYWGDVFWQEPYYGKISECNNAILTPHIATYSKQCRESMETEAVLNLLEDLGICTKMN